MSSTTKQYIQKRFSKCLRSTAVRAAFVATSCMLFATGSARADTEFDFNFSKGTSASEISVQKINKVGSDSGSYLYEKMIFTDISSGRQVDVTAGVVLPDGSTESSRVGQYSGGLGATHYRSDGQHTVDEYYRDFLILDFGSVDVDVNELRFRYFSPITSDGTSLADVQVYKDEISPSNLIGQGNIPYNPGEESHGVLTFDPGLVGNIFVITPLDDGVGYKGKYNDQFKLYGVSGHASADDNVVVPSPASAIAAIPMLGVLGLRRRHK